MASVMRRFFRGASSRQAVPYPDPFVDIAQFNIPPSIKSLMIMCRRLFLTHSTIFPVVWKYASYPITDIRIEAATENIKQDWEYVVTTVLKLKAFIHRIGLDYFCYGNGMASIVFPFDKYLICPECSYEQKAPNAQFGFNATGQWDYRGNCPACKKTTIYVVEDREVKRAYNRLKLIQWPPLSIDIDYNPYTDDREYYHRIPRLVRDKLAAGSKLMAATLPKEFIQAAKSGKRIKLEKDNFFHIARPSISDSRLSFSPWGLPLILPVIKDAFWMQVLKKAEEAQAMNRINPLRVLFPMEGNQPVFAGHNLALVRNRLESELRKWIRDPNYIAVVPSQIGSITVGADANIVLLMQAIQNAAETIVAGMGCPRSFIYGGTTFSASSVEMRCLENDFLSYRSDINNLIHQMLRRIRTYLEWPECKSKLSTLRSADDVQMRQFASNLHASGKLSDDTYLGDLGFNNETERKKKRAEFEQDLSMQKLQAQAAAEAQGEGMLITSRYQMEAQMRMMDTQQKMQQQNFQAPPGVVEPTDQEAIASDIEQAGNKVIPLQEMLAQHTQELIGMDQGGRDGMLANIHKSNPIYAQQLRKQLGSQGTLQQQDMRPLPEQLPPRRKNSPV